MVECSQCSKLHSGNGHLAARCGYRCVGCQRASRLTAHRFQWLWLISAMHPHWKIVGHVALACHVLWCMIITSCFCLIYQTSLIKDHLIAGSCTFWLPVSVLTDMFFAHKLWSVPTFFFPFCKTSSSSSPASQQFRHASSILAADIPPAFLKKKKAVRIAGWSDMESGSRAATVGDGAANISAAHLWLDLVNASSPPTRWDSSPPAEGTGLEDQQWLFREQAYRDFTTTIQVFILIGSLLGKSVHIGSWTYCSFLNGRPITYSHGCYRQNTHTIMPTLKILPVVFMGFIS